MSLEWKRMKDAPRKGEKHVLLFTTDHGIVEAWFRPGQWDNNFGPVWVCGDDAYQIEVKEYRDQEGLEYPYHDRTAKAWAEMPNLPPPFLIGVSTI